MADIAIRPPVPLKRAGNLMEVKTPLSNGANTFLAGSLVKRDSSVKMAACATGDIVCLGWSAGPSTTSTQKRPEIFWRDNYPLDPTDVEFIMNVTDTSGHVSSASSAPQASAVTIGSSYGLYRWTSGAYAGIQAVNKDDTSTTLVTVTGLAPDALATDYNGLVLVKIIPSKIQQ